MKKTPGERAARGDQQDDPARPRRPRQYQIALLFFGGTTRYGRMCSFRAWHWLCGPWGTLVERTLGGIYPFTGPRERRAANAPRPVKYSSNGTLSRPHAVKTASAMVVARDQRERKGIGRSGLSSSIATQIAFVLSLVAVGYAFLAGLRTLTVTDLGWQLATARWIVQHHEIPSTDVFSYTAHGQPWVYPVGSGLLFYGAHLIGGYSLLS